MKVKIIAVTVVITFFTFNMFGCSDYKIANDFSASPMNNSFNNCLSGGKIAYMDGSVYAVCTTSDIFDLGTYKINNDGISSLSDANPTVDYAFESQIYFNDSSNLYSFSNVNNTLLKYDKDKNIFTDACLDISPFSSEIYMSDDLIVYFSDNGLLNVKYASNPEYTLRTTVVNFTVKNDTVYVINDNGYLYSNNVTSGEGKCLFLDKLNSSLSYNFMEVCNDYIFLGYLGTNDSEKEPGLYCYSITKKQFDIVTNDIITGFNSYQNEFFYSNNTGVYKVFSDSNSNLITEKISDITAEEIYICDDKWLYFYNNGKIIRCDRNGKNIEKVF